nr:hypothetical protein [Rhodococcus sp. HNM0569]
MLSKPVRGRLISLAATVSSIGLLAGCSGGGDGGDAASAPTTGNAVTVPVSAVGTELLDPGAEPRDVLRPAPTAGATQTAQLTTSATVFQQIDDQTAQDFSTPELTLPLDATVDRADADGTEVDLTIGEPTSPDPTLDGAVQASAGSGAGLTFAPNGSITALRLSPTDSSQDIARSAIEQAFYQAVYRTIAFPTEPIGVGARWAVRQEVMSGIALDQVTTVTLTGRDGDGVTLDFTVEQTPQSSVWALPGDAGDLTVDQYVMQGTGTARIDLAQALPTSLTVSIGGEQAYSDPDGTTHLRQTTDNKVALEARPDREGQ